MGIQIQVYVGDNDTLKTHPDITSDGWLAIGGHGCQSEDEMREYVQRANSKFARVRIGEIEGPTKF